jgi:hypothetical protein
MMGERHREENGKGPMWPRHQNKVMHRCVEVAAGSYADADGKIYTVRYDAVNAMLLNEFLK